MRRLVSACAFVALATACYSTPQPNCSFKCGATMECPDNYVCSTTDNICHLVSNGQVLACETADGPSIPDSPVTITPDSPISTTPDSPVITPDAPPVVTPDSPIEVPDSPPPPPDSPLPMPDAPTPDAAQPLDAPAPDA